MRDINGRFYPGLSPKQLDVFNDTRTRMLLSGPRWCGKTIVAVHKCIKHAWRYDNDRVGIFVKSTKIGKLGVYDDLLTYALPEWCEGLADEGFKIIKQGQDGTTRTHYVVIQNMHGGESEIQLHSLHHEDSVNEKLKGSRFGCLFFDEVDNYDNAEVFNVSTMQLRQIGLPAENHLWIGTCNPAGDDDHWLYQKFWIEMHDETIDPKYRAMFACHEFKMSDNPYVPEEKWTELKLTYRNDPEMYQRFVEGKWVPDTRSVHFAGAFRQNFHVRGNLKDGTVLLPTQNCSEIVAGWDLGDRNNSVVFLEHVTTGNADYWSILDDVSHVHEDLALEDFVAEVLETMGDLMDLCGGKVRFKHWSDRSAFDRYRSAADARDHILVSQYSKGAINLIGCPKPPNSVAARVALVRQMLMADRLFTSVHCQGIVDMFKRLSKGKTKADYIKRDDRYIHRFDAMSYALYGENIDAIEENLRPRTGAPLKILSVQC